jgi:hypothetical protein
VTALTVNRLTRRDIEALEGQFAEVADNQPELLARHCTAAGLARAQPSR